MSDGREARGRLFAAISFEANAHDAPPWHIEPVGHCDFPTI
jgi:hypothetical protein